MADGTTAQPPPGLDLDRLRAYLEREHPGLVDGELSGELIQGGRSNLTYVIGDGTRRWVLRRPPLGHVLATAHDMSREYRVLSALADTDVPVPRTYLLCEDEQVLGAPFFIMDLVAGTAYRSEEQTRELSTEQRRDLAMRLVEVLARLHAVDPDSVGLGDFGKPDGFLERQLRRWSKQLAASQQRELRGVTELRDRLAAGVPTNGRVAIVHGDYRLDNVLVDQNCDIRAVLDWEMATLGDPLTDLGLLVVYWEGFSGIADNPVAKGVGPEFGFPGAREMLRHYAELNRIDTSELDWYVAFGFFKIAVILEGIHYRFTQNQTVGEGFEHVGALVEPLIEQGLANIPEK
ncbi:Predicted kinase, aminoglycoside phosphotransferase (APT) family [Actinopolyspora xinjiangensis]|uniref:Predicted kinase, aminoglycoside phosphotransferase (APT) family n=1 Tax=Actinopolyspora xinjiangensis TaxID=405564 RepID=A0A1H0WV86_9ACTN|nr:phosphotransferase family protein [Actinopolyspora xinjiangensis]SDP94684.1 Predicted kinase, aminoglycoside phosphotransferase (APT) family [Actinopolyspora xinjiangensis]